jgi:hypothetical protein
MFDHEPPRSVNPTATREEQPANIRQTYPPEREVVAIGIEHIDPRPQPWSRRGARHDTATPRDHRFGRQDPGRTRGRALIGP